LPNNEREIVTKFPATDLYESHYKLLIIARAARYLICGFDNGLGQLRVQPVFLIDGRCRTFEDAKGFDKGWRHPLRLTTNLEVLDGASKALSQLFSKPSCAPLGLGAPVAVARHIDVTKRVALSAVACRCVCYAAGREETGASEGNRLDRQPAQRSSSGTAG
jgi:hypothetical protein